MKKQRQTLKGKIFANHVSDNAPVFRMYKELSKFNN